VATDSSWQRRAACHDHPTLPPRTWDVDLPGEMQHPHDAAGREARLARWAQAVQVCDSCPVYDLCGREASHPPGGNRYRTVDVIRAGRVWGFDAPRRNAAIRERLGNRRRLVA